MIVTCNLMTQAVQIGNIMKASMPTTGAVNGNSPLTRHTPEGTYQSMASSSEGDNLRDFTSCTKVIDWVEEKRKLCQPIKLVVIDGSEQQKQEIIDLMCKCRLLV